MFDFIKNAFSRRDARRFLKRMASAKCVMRISDYWVITDGPSKPASGFSMAKLAQIDPLGFSNCEKMAAHTGECAVNRFAFGMRNRTATVKPVDSISFATPDGAVLACSLTGIYSVSMDEDFTFVVPSHGGQAQSQVIAVPFLFYVTRDSVTTNAPELLAHLGGKV